MSKKPDGGPAFPRGEFGEHGMSLRDYFAGQALMGFIAGPQMQDLPSELASGAYKSADAMLAERTKNNDK